MVNATEIRALVVSPDSEMVAVFAAVFREIGVSTQSCADASNAIDVLSTAKFEALVFDFDNVSASVPIISRLGEGASSKDAIILAVATQISARQCAFAQGANFAFERPFVMDSIRQALRTAYALMLHDRRRYFRCPVECSIRIQRDSGAELRATTINVSRKGMAVKVPVPLEVGENFALDVEIAEAGLSADASGSDRSRPPSGSRASFVGTVVWDDKHGKAGISFECASLDVKNRLAAWLDTQFWRQLKCSTAEPHVPLS